MRGSYQWAMLRLAILAAFVIPATFMNPSAHSSTHTGSWLAAVEVAEPVMALHAPEAKPTLPAEVVAEIKHSASLAAEAQQEAVRALRQELARELIRMRQQKNHSNQSRS